MPRNTTASTKRVRQVLLKLFIFNSADCHIDFYFAAPLSLGSKDGYYYINTVNVDNRYRPLPFSIILLVRIGGSVQFARYY